MTDTTTDRIEIHFQPTRSIERGYLQGKALADANRRGPMSRPYVAEIKFAGFGGGWELLRTPKGSIRRFATEADAREAAEAALAESVVIERDLVTESDKEVFRGARADCILWVDTHGAKRLHAIIAAKTWDAAGN
jgi:hypothetical protein